jgi:hypothetical protein
MASSAPPPNDALDKIFQGLKSKNGETRVQAAQDLRRYVCTFKMWKECLLILWLK